MGLENEISIEPVQAKLKNLRTYLSDKSGLVYEFGVYLADELNLTRELKQKIDPTEFCIIVELSILCLRNQPDSPAEQKRRTNLLCYSPREYRNLRKKIPLIAKVVCSEDFAEKVKQVEKEISLSFSL